MLRLHSESSFFLHLTTCIVLFLHLKTCAVFILRLKTCVYRHGIACAPQNMSRLNSAKCTSEAKGGKWNVPPVSRESLQQFTNLVLAAHDIFPAVVVLVEKFRSGEEEPLNAAAKKSMNRCSAFFTYRFTFFYISVIHVVGCFVRSVFAVIPVWT